MDRLDPGSFRLLKKLYKVDDYVFVPESRVLRKLLSVSFLERNQPLTFLDKPLKKPVLWKINDKGREYYLLHRERHREWLIPLIISYLISIAAIVISIIALTR